jgi:hypothetical protein
MGCPSLQRAAGPDSRRALAGQDGCGWRKQPAKTAGENSCAPGRRRAHLPFKSNWRLSRMHRIKSVGVLSVAKISGLCYFALGVIFIPFIVLFALIGAAVGAQTGTPVQFGPLAAVLLAVFMPVFYGAIGFVFGAIAAFIYNLVAGWVGGIEFELQPLDTAPRPVTLAATGPSPAC